jgi:transposase
MARKRAEIIELDAKRVEELLRRAEEHSFEADDYQTIRVLVESYACLTSMLGDKNTTIARLRKLLFGASTEKTDAVVGQVPPSCEGPAADGAAWQPAEQNSPRKKGHGRNGADAYAGAEKIDVPHDSLRAGDACPDCREGTVYTTAPGVLVRIVGQAPLGAKVYRLEKLRCNLCGKVYTAPAPQGVGTEKYDATAASMIGVLKYGSGLPFNRIEGLQGNLKIPLPAATQWEIVHAAAANLTPAYDELLRQAAQGELLQNDDTAVKILELMGKRARKHAIAEGAADGLTNKDGSQRTGLFTSGVVSTREGHRIALFFSGRQHAGENLRDVLRQRSPALDPPLHMCDALSRNVPGELATIIANCLAHARRNFVDVYERFPDECRHVLEALKVVYKNDAEARQQQLSPQERLVLHQAQSRPVMNELHDWLEKQFDDHLVEPNSPLGGAILYMLAHWDKLTLFLRQAGAPLDNNLCEQVLKKAILHRKNALFYKTQNGARVGDMYMSLIHTCELCGAGAFDYLTELQRHAAEVAAKPADWMPWNYRQSADATQNAA